VHKSMRTLCPLRFLESECHDLPVTSISERFTQQQPLEQCCHLPILGLHGTALENIHQSSTLVNELVLHLHLFASTRLELWRSE